MRDSRRGGGFSLGLLRGGSPVVVVDLVVAGGVFGVDLQGLPAGLLLRGMGGGADLEFLPDWRNPVLLSHTCSPPWALPAGLRWMAPL